MKSPRYFKICRSFFALLLAVCLAGCATTAQQQNMTQAPPSAPLDTPLPMDNNVRRPLPPPTAVPIEPSEEYETLELQSVLPGSSNTFDPFTYGRAGSPYSPGRIFASTLGARCGPMVMPMSADFADPGDSQAVIIIAGDGLECSADIDHDKPGAAVTFPLNSAIFINSPWVILSQTTTTVTITNRAVTLRFTFKITASETIISRVEYL